MTTPRKRTAAPKAEQQPQALIANNQRIPVVRSPTYVHVVVDSAAGSPGVGTTMDLSVFTFQTRFLSQEVHPVASENGAQTAQLGSLEGGSIMVENASLRLSPEVAITTVEVILKHLLQAGATSKEDVRVLMKTLGVIEE